jgi:levansucrase
MQFVHHGNMRGREPALQTTVHPTVTPWTAAQVAAIDSGPVREIPLITSADVAPIIDGIDVWDSWPLTDADGRTVMIDGAEHWIMLSAAVTPDPLKRHDSARMRHLTRRNGQWSDQGNLLPDGLSPGLREWAGSAIFDAETRRIDLFYTVTGRIGEASSFEQRLFSTSGTLDKDGRCRGWTPPVEIVATDGDFYCDTRMTQGGPGMIKGFRDPAWFRDPDTHQAWLTFVGSYGRSRFEHNGVIGLIRRDGIGWTLLPPIITADGVCNEMERPHLLARDGQIYLFWSTQRHVFAPGASGPNGLYGAVADNVLGPYRLLNGTGLVAANPASEPFQCYSWLVTGDLSVAAFVDYWGMDGRTVSDTPEIMRTHFGGTPAPPFTIWLDGDRAGIVNA